MPDTLGQQDQVEKPSSGDSAEDERKPVAEEAGEDKEEDADASVVSCPDPYYPPIIYLPEVEVNSGEDEEEEIIKMRAHLYRYASDCEPPEWKQRGTGDIKILQHTLEDTCRIVMRREKTLKLCANHQILPWMELRRNCGSDKAWVWNTQADFCDGEYKKETLAVRFSSAAKALQWEKAFEKARKFVLEKEAEKIYREQGRDPKELSSKTEAKKVVTSAAKEVEVDAAEEEVAETTEDVVENGSAEKAESLVERMGEITVAEKNN